MPPVRSLSTRHELGRAYRDLLVLGNGQLGLARKEHLLSLFAGEDELVHLDLEGRLHRAWLGGRSFQRGLDGRVRRVTLAGAGVERSLSIEVLSSEAAATVLARVRELVARAAAELPTDAAAALAEPLGRALARVGGAAEQAEAERFRATYEKIPILPPDQNRALVIQLTSGCSWNRCAFCHLYRDATFSLKTPAALADHVERVVALLGRALPLRRGVFLGQANALVVARDKLLPLLDVMHEELRRAEAPQALASFAAFVDAFSRPKTVNELSELRARGLSGVSLGLESGSDDVQKTLGKPAEAAQAIAVVDALHAARIGVGVIVLVGAGGRRLGARHVEETVETISRMRLTRGDRVYLSPLFFEPGSGFERRVSELGVLAPAELTEQAGELRAGLRSAGVNVPIARYDIRRFIY